MTVDAEGFVVAILNVALSGGPVPRGQVCEIGVKFGLLRDRGHDGLGGTSYGLTDDGMALKKRVESESARRKIAQLKVEIERLEKIANG